MTDRNYYLVPEGSETHKVICDLDAERLLTTQMWCAFAKKYGTDRIGHNSVHLLGIGLDSPPDGWLECKSLPGCYRPHSRLKACREAYKEFKALPSLKGGWEFSDALNTGIPMHDGLAHYPTYEIIGGQVVLSLHKKHKVPDDVTPLKHSEYWALKEQVAHPQEQQQ